MKYIKTLCLTALMMLCLTSQAQFFQDMNRQQWMLKVELGAMPFMSNEGHPGDYGYFLNNYQSAIGLDVIGGLNLNQDFFVGLGAGGYYAANIATPSVFNIAATAFADIDYRPIWSSHGDDNTPQTYRLAPMAGIRGGMSVLLDDAERYGTNFDPYGEIYAGVNWYYRHGLRNMEHNWYSLYLQIGIAYMQQTVFLPVRIGWRM
ncbi:MAG: hypothetical protein K5650_04460 [Bacteroidales bacterium]|nr:hypothetical protein [Bacteroidales bacterium]